MSVEVTQALFDPTNAKDGGLELWKEIDVNSSILYRALLNLTPNSRLSMKTTKVYQLNMLEIPVKLIVKAPNQQVEDQTIHCSLSWTIKRLKGYLSEVYPSKPNTEDQRLIYYGQLLNDSVTLKDVFTRYEAGEETHTVHLVCMPSKESLKKQARKMAEESSKNNQESGAGTASTASLGRSVDGEGGTPEAIQPSHLTGRNHFRPASYQHWMNTVNSHLSPANNYMQQWAWIQQVYANYYMSQYMDMIARQNGVAFREGYDNPRQTEAALNPEPQVAQNADDDDNRLNRDWLDYFYTFSRLLVLLSIVYFYSSPARFLIVSSLGMALYLYQIGFFRINQFQAVDNNNEMVNNNMAAENNNVIPQGELAEVERVEHPRPDPEQVFEPPEQHPSFLALTWTFLTSFFSSMIPETQNAL